MVRSEERINLFIPYPTPRVVGSSPTRRALVDVAQLVEPRVVIPVVVGSSPIVHPIITFQFASVAELVDALDLGSSGVTRESSSLSSRTIFYFVRFQWI